MAAEGGTSQVQQEPPRSNKNLPGSVGTSQVQQEPPRSNRNLPGPAASYIEEFILVYIKLDIGVFK